RKVNVASNGKTYQGWVGSNDTDDYHAFSLGATNEFELSLDGLSNDANVELLDKEGNVILSSANSGTAAESISTTLSTGNYRVRVNSADEFGTPYNMKLTVNSLLEGITTTGSDTETFLNTQESLPLIRVDDLNSGNTPGLRQDPRFTNIDGRGWTTVIIDSGMNLDHPFFGNQINGRSERIVSSIDLSDSPFADNDVDGHGSNVASIAAGSFNDPNNSNNNYSGVAPGANLVNLKVFQEQRDPVTGQPVRDANGDILSGNFGWTEQALQWVIENAGINPELNIASVNMSLSGDLNWQQAVSKYGLGDELQKLSDLGIIVVSASGNDFSRNNSQQGVGYPSADPNSLSIGSVSDTTDQIVSSSQRSGALTTVFAPGSRIRGAGLNDTPGAGFTTNLSGTSMAAPHVAGMAVLAQQLAVERLGRKLTPDEFQDLLVQTGDLINDGDDENDNVANTGLNFRRANMLSLAEGIEAKRPENILRNSPRPVTVNIRRVTGDFDGIFRGDSDFYAILIVDGKEYRSSTINGKNEITPNWEFTNNSSKELVPITIRIREADGILNPDDQIDLNPNQDSEDLNLLFNQ
ncbi:MAG: S8 family serine peptidase, partial [Cyanobacteria bacterium J06641_2]